MIPLHSWLCPANGPLRPRVVSKPTSVLAINIGSASVLAIPVVWLHGPSKGDRFLGLLRFSLGWRDRQRLWLGRRGGQVCEQPDGRK